MLPLSTRRGGPLYIGGLYNFKSIGSGPFWQAALAGTASLRTKYPRLNYWPELLEISELILSSNFVSLNTPLKERHQLSSAFLVARSWPPPLLATVIIMLRFVNRLAWGLPLQYQGGFLLPLSSTQQTRELRCALLFCALLCVSHGRKQKG